MKNLALNKVQEVVERHMRDHRVVPVDLAASCVFVALSQAVILGNKVKAGELPIQNVPMSAPGELMAMLKDDPDVLAMFRQIGGAIYSVASLGNKVLTFHETKGIFNINLGASDVVENNPRLREALDQIGYEVANGKDVQKMALATAWYWIFHRYQHAAERLHCRDASFSSFADSVPDDLCDCMCTLIRDPELAILIPK